MPGALIGVAAGTLLTVGLDLPIARVQVPATLLEGIRLPTMESFAGLAQPGVIATVLIIAVIASAETLLSAAAVDRMHDGERTRFNKELVAQGVGNSLCGLLGALPVTGVIVRSSANIQAGAATRRSTILHGVWILALVALLPQLLGVVPLTALAAVLLVTGWRLVSLQHVRHLFDHHGWVPVAVWGVTVSLVVVQDLLVGVAVGLFLSIMEIIPFLRRKLHIDHHENDESIQLKLKGVGTCRDVPALLATLESLPDGKKVLITPAGLHYVDHTYAETLTEWVTRERRAGRPLEVSRSNQLAPKVASMVDRLCVKPA